MYSIFISFLNHPTEVLEGTGKVSGRFIIRGGASGDNSMLELASHCPNIETFIFYRCNKYTTSGITSLARNCRGINAFYINSGKFLDGALKSVTENLTELLYLNLKGCVGLTNKGMKSIASNAPNLKELSIEACNHITDEGIQSVAEGCRKIQKINVSSCWELSDEAVFHIAANLNRLSALNISRCSNLSDVSLQRLGSFSPNIEVLKMSSMSMNITSDGLCRLFRKLPKLKNLTLSMCSDQVDDQVVATVAVNCPELKVLDIGRCNLLTFQALVSLGQHRPTIEELNVFECFHFSEEDLDQIKQVCPNLKLYGSRFG